MKKYLYTVLLLTSFFQLKAQESDSVVYAAEDSASYDMYEDESGYEEEENSETPPELIAPQEMSSTQAYREEKVKVKKFDPKKWKQIVGDTDYHEKEQKARAESKPINFTWAGPFLKVISYIVIIALVILLIYFVVKNISFRVQVKKIEYEAGDLERAVENIEEIDFDILLKQALADGNYRMAIRLYYLRLLKKLNEEGRIAWKKNKTNRDYLLELFSANYFFDEMKALTLSYEQVWYGERTLTSENYQTISGRFEAAFQKLNTPDTP